MLGFSASCAKRSKTWIEAALAEHRRRGALLLHYGIEHFGSREILRFLGKRAGGGLPDPFPRRGAEHPAAAARGGAHQALRGGQQRVGRLLRLQRAHHLIKKLPKRQRYQLTRRGREIIAALQTARSTDLHALLELAAWASSQENKKGEGSRTAGRCRRAALRTPHPTATSLPPHFAPPPVGSAAIPDPE